MKQTKLQMMREKSEEFSKNAKVGILYKEEWLKFEE